MNEKTVPGMLTLEKLNEGIEADKIETVVTVFPDLYGRLMGKRIDAAYFVESVAESGMHACNYLYTVDMEMEPIPGYSYANWESGYGDFHCVPDLNTLRVATWMDKSALVFCDTHEVKTHEPTAVSPRNILKRQLETAAEMGYAALGASELEYYILKETYDSSRAKNYFDLTLMGSYIEDYLILQGGREEPLNASARRHLSASGVPVEFSKGEWGPGQHELNIRFAEILEMADRHMIYKQCFKDLADQLGLAVTFMAKYDSALAGSSCHIHMSLWDKLLTENIFQGDNPLGTDPSLPRVSNEFRWFLGGWIAHAAELMPFFAPTINSYKRFQAGSWAPTGLAWSFDNRTAGFRVVGQEQSVRIETRVPGADINPYLAYAALLAAGLDGIRNQIDPPEMFAGDVYSAQDLPQVPKTLRDAIGCLEKSAFAREAFGDRVIDHYLHFYKVEQATFDNAVTDWERIRYFEQI